MSYFFFSLAQPDLAQPNPHPPLQGTRIVPEFEAKMKIRTSTHGMLFILSWSHVLFHSCPNFYRDYHSLTILIGKPNRFHYIRLWSSDMGFELSNYIMKIFVVGCFCPVKNIKPSAIFRGTCPLVSFCRCSVGMFLENYSLFV